MNTKKKTIIAIVIFAAFLVIVSAAYNELSDNYQSNDQMELSALEQYNREISAPDFTVFDAQGNEVNLSDFAGKPVVLNFWASWCPPCKAEMPHFDKVYKEVKDDVVFMMVDLVDGQRETQEKGQKYVTDQDYTFPVYFDNEQNAAYIYGISSIPTTLFIDGKGNIIASREGILEEATLKAAVELIKVRTEKGK